MLAPDLFEIVLVGDVVEEALSHEDVFDWDNPTWPEVQQIQHWLAQAGRRSRVVSSVASFPAIAADMQNSLVFPLWRGGALRGRTSVVPAICEAVGLPWIGADAFAQGVCQDKSLSKHFLGLAGIGCAEDVVIRSVPIGSNTLSALRGLPLPAVVKPLYAACSIGINESSICRQLDELIACAEKLIRDGLGPVMCETFVAGEEVSLCMVEGGSEILMRCSVEYRAPDGESLDGRLITFDDKVRGDGFLFRDVGSNALENLWLKIRLLLGMLGPTHLLRLDGRLAGDRFTAIELTPDIHLGLESAFLGGFSACGIEPREVLLAAVNVAESLKRDGTLQRSHSAARLARK